MGAILIGRPEPPMPPGAYRTFGVAAPLSTHFVKATCAEVSCPDYQQGWRVHIEAIGPQFEHAARTSGRKFTEVSYGDGQTWLLFEAGQPCFRASEHTRRLEREERFYVRSGDWRGDPSRTGPREISGTAWLDEFGEHQDRLATTFERG